MLIIWILVLVLIVAVVVMFWMLIKKQQNTVIDTQSISNLEHQVKSLELNLQKTLLVVQDLAKTMHVQQQALDQVQLKLNQFDSQR